jgi:hypothetical protein
MKIRVFGFLASISLLISVIIPLVTLRAQETPSPLLINRVKLGGVVIDEPTEYVEIYNRSTDSIALDSWTLEYAKPAAKITDCDAKNWKLQDSSANVKITALSGTVNPASRVLVELAMNDNVGGSLRLSGSEGFSDLVGWGSETSKAVCKDLEYAPIPANAKTIWRILSADGSPQDSDNNKVDFTDKETMIEAPNEEADVCPNLSGVQIEAPVGYELSNGECRQDIVVPTEACIGVSLSEILPNPEGTDTGVEYIELFNGTNQVINLDGCSIKVGSAVKELTGTIQPGHLVIRGVTLPNSAGGVVEFITPTTEEAVAYPGGLADNIAWALVNGVWQETNRPTPGEANVISVAEATVVSSKESLGACPAGKYRNPATNRCKSLTVAAGLKPCDPGQYRNPETNRCKSTAAALTTLKPCSPGQVRNPATNRCRKADSGAVLKACAIGQERNPETNRCRKVAGASTSTPSSELDKAVESKRSVSFTVLGIVAVLALGYGLYEYRESIAGYFARLRTRN